VTTLGQEVSVSNVRYEQAARDFDDVRARRPEAQKVWCKRMAEFLPEDNLRAVVDVGSGTGIWAHAVATLLDLEVYGVEPSHGMRTHAAAVRPHPNVHYLAGTAEALPLEDNSVDAAWLSTVIHQFPDLGAAARELRRVIRPGGPVLIRSSFPGRQDEIELFHTFPGAMRLAGTWPRLGQVITAFEDAGFRFETLDRVREPTFDTYDEFLELLPLMRHSDTALVDVDDYEWEAGVERIRRAKEEGKTPWVLGLDLLVMR
jgi:ubiquinone/menaquinone biosynthesis C-methylase UbiE